MPNKKAIRAVVAILLAAISGGCGNLTRDVHDLQARSDEQQRQLDGLQTQVAFLEAMLEADLAAIKSLGADNAAQQGQLEALQASVHTLTVQLATLQGYTGIVGLVDPCGAKAGYYNEVLLKLSNGQILASFSDKANGQNTRFAILPNGTYTTSDGTNCTFTVQNGGLVNEHY